MNGEQAFNKLLRFVGKLIEEIRSELGTSIEITSVMRANKGFGGLLIEIFFGKRPDNVQLPDLDDGTEVKKVSIIKGKRGYRVKETVQVTMINPSNPLCADFKDSHLYAKTRKILLVPTLYAGKGMFEKEMLLPPVLWVATDESDAVLEADYHDVRSAIDDPKRGFMALTGKMGVRVQPRTKGSKESFTRAFYFRTQTVAEMLGPDYLLKLQFL